MAQRGVGTVLARGQRPGIVVFVAACALAAAVFPPRQGLAQTPIPSSSCSGVPTSATTCFTGTYVDSVVSATSLGSGGANGGGWNVYSNANLSANSASILRLVDVSSIGGQGVSGGTSGGSGGMVTVRNDGTLSWLALSNPFLFSPIVVLSVESEGGAGYTPSNNGYGGSGGSTQTLSVTNTGAITLGGRGDFGLVGLRAFALGGSGGNGNQNAAFTNYYGGRGGDAGQVYVNNSGAIVLGTTNSLAEVGYLAAAINAASQGGAGGDGSCSNYTTCSNGNANATGNGGAAGIVSITNTASIGVSAAPQGNIALFGIRATAFGGAGADSENNYSSGGIGGEGGSIYISNSSNVSLSWRGTGVVDGAGIYALAQGGHGGTGNKENSSGDGVAGSGGSVAQRVSVGNQAASVFITQVGSGIVSTAGDNLAGIVALAQGGNGGAGGSDWESSNSNGGTGGTGGVAVVQLNNTAQVLTAGQSSPGIVARSLGGLGGNGGNDGGLVGQDGGAGYGGAAGSSSASAAAGTLVQTVGDHSTAIVAQSIGGGGGSGSDFVGVLGGQGGDGGRGGDACSNPGSSGCAAVFNTAIQALGTVGTSGSYSYGLLAQSIGGAGGAGGIATGLVYSLGGDGGGGGGGGGVTVYSAGTITTQGYGSHGILAQSIGGGGGAAGVSSGAISIGGDGATNYAAGGGQVIVNQASGLVQTVGDAAVGIMAQSIGGGGGSGAGANGIISVGGKGSAGGDGDAVQVTVNGGVGTAGSYSHGVLAQSIGGGGGFGGNVLDFGFGVPAVGVGGSSAGGGKGGAATIDFSGAIVTSGDHAVGLFAQSVGGGGGTGGDVNELGLLSFTSLAIGGGASTAAGGAGGIVTINASGTPTVQTAGAYGVGVLAQSVGGGGGTGGNASVYNASVNFATSVAVGGDSGGGGDGSTVSANWHGGNITTGAGMRDMSLGANVPIALYGQASNAYGLLVQSIGGGGGSGGSSSVDQFIFSVPTTDYTPIPTFNITASLGGTGGTGGSGGTAGVELSGASIVTWGAGAHAFVAQSIGGGGGTGGDASALGVAAAIPKTNELPTFAASVALGASGGTGGSGGTVSVSVDGASSLTTYGDNANALVAQSIGGGGGDGGIGSAATYTLFEGTSLKTSLGLGGKGGSGGAGGEVTVGINPVAQITTVGSGARGVVAQSIGGGGGTSQGGTAGLSVGSFVGSVQVGRTGGGGGNGGNVSVTSGASIATLAKDADGILAQSVGGGGGLGGTFGADGSWDDPNWINVVWDVQRVVKTLTDQGGGYSMTVTVGGGGGAGGAAGAVTISNTGPISTSGDWADGIVAQSIGGGGGAGGTAVADGSQQTASVNVGVGGSGGAAGNGSTVTIQNVGTIVTQGYGAYGLLAQSIGGGGGQGGDGSAKSTGKITVGGGVGGGAGSSGDGGMVQLLDTAAGTNVSTIGDYAHAMVLQSIGGGGGVGGSGSSTTPLVFNNQGFEILVGGSGGSSGDGCAVTVGAPSSTSCQSPAAGNGTTLQIETQGQGAFGLLAQSIGGGGGIGGAANASQTTSVAVGGSGGTSGNGGAVSLYLADSSIATAGAGAHAVVAQSIGGGGGIGGVPSGGALSFVGPSLGSGSSGNGGDVTVVTGAGSRIVTTGDSAFGILAQSIGGGGGLSGTSSGVFAGSNGGANSTSGTVTVTVDGTVSASGTNSIAVIAQSVATETTGTSSSAGAITVKVNGTVVGGSKTPASAVLAIGGNNDNIINIGKPGSVSALSGNAISYHGDYSLAVANGGTLQGNVLLRGDRVAVGTLTNTGTLIAGSLLDANVTNSGRLSVVHSSSAFATTRIGGNFTQSATGVTTIGADFATGTSDRLEIGGNAVLDGRIGFDFRSIRPNQALVVLSADGGITGKLTPENGPGLFTYQLKQAGKQLSVSATGANFAGPGFGLNAHQAAVAGGLQSIWNSGGGAFDTLFAALQNLAGSGGYADALSKLAPGVALAPAARTRDNIQEFSSNLMSCPVFENDTALVGETSCTWARVGGRLTNQSSSGGVAGFNNKAMNYQLGTQWEIAPDWFLGGSIAYQQSWLAGADGRVSTNGSGAAAGLALKRQAGPWLFAASLGGSSGWYDSKRLIAIPGFTNLAYGSSNVLSGQGRLRAAYSFVFNDWYVRPYADVDLIHVNAPGYSETGAGALGLTYGTASQWTAAFSPTLEVGGRVNMINGYVLRPYGSIGLSAYTTSDWTASARLQGGQGVGSFSTSIATDPVVARLSAGIQLMAQDRFDLKLTYDGGFSEHTVSNALSLRAGLRF